MSEKLDKLDEALQTYRELKEEYREINRAIRKGLPITEVDDLTYNRYRDAVDELQDLSTIAELVALARAVEDFSPAFEALANTRMEWCEGETEYARFEKLVKLVREIRVSK